MATILSDESVTLIYESATDVYESAIHIDESAAHIYESVNKLTTKQALQNIYGEND